jgi:hypothetical protein
MTESDWIIMNGIISMAVTALSTIIAFLIIEKKIVSVNQRWLIHGLIFFVGIIIAAVFPMKTLDNGRLELRIITLIGICISGLSLFSFLISNFLLYEKSIGKRMVENARKYAAELALSVQGIPEDKKYDFKKLNFTYSGFLDNRWGFLTYDETKTTKSNSSRTDFRYQHFYVYKLRLSTNKEIRARIFCNESNYNFVPLEDESIIRTNHSDFDEELLIFCSAGAEKLLNILENEAFRNFLLSKREFLRMGMSINLEPEIVTLNIRKGHPKFGLFTNNYKLEFDYHLANRKAHLEFFKQFAHFFDR